MNPMAIALIILGAVLLIVLLCAVIANARDKSKPDVLPPLPEAPKPAPEAELRFGPVKRPVPAPKPAPEPEEGYQSIYSFLPGFDRSVCPNCGAEYARSAKLCSVCGQRLS